MEAYKNLLNKINKYKRKIFSDYLIEQTTNNNFLKRNKYEMKNANKLKKKELKQQKKK